MKKYILSIIIMISLAGNVYAVPLAPIYGGTGFASTSAANIGKCLSVSSVVPFIYTWATCAVGSATTTINGILGPTFTISTSSVDTNIGIEISTSLTNIYINPYWIGTLANSRIASSSYWNSAIYTEADPFWAASSSGYLTISSSIATYFTIAGANASNTAWSSDIFWTGTSTGLVASTGRTSLGLGTMATANTTDYVSTTTGLTYLLGSASSSFAWRANNLSDLNSTSTARTNLGLLDASLLASSTWLKVANNLNDGVTSTMRTNLGLVIGTNVQAYDANNATATGQATYIAKFNSATGLATTTLKFCFSLENASDTDDNVPIWTPDANITLRSQYCRVQGGTNVVGFTSDGTNVQESLTCVAGGTADDGSLTNATYSANERIEWDTTSVSGSVTWLNVCVYYTVD